jgi:RNA polymerase sigma-70 factor (ECF subfamily)
MSLSATSPSRRIADVEAVFREHRTLVLAVLRRHGLPDRDLHDALQEVFIVVHRRLVEFEGRASLSTWLYRIARNVASDYRRRASHRNERLSEVGVLPELPSEPSVEGERSELERVLRVVEHLPEPQREVFVLYELLELPMREVAARLRCPLKTAFTRLYAARRQLLTELERGHWLGGFVLALRPARLRLDDLVAPAPAPLVLTQVVIAGLCVVLPASHAPVTSAARAPVAASAQVAATAQDAVNVSLAAREPTPSGAKLDKARAPRTRRAPVAARATPAAPPVVEAPPTIELEGDLDLYRASAADLRPIGEHPFAARLGYEPVISRPIRIHGPEDPALALERELSTRR